MRASPRIHVDTHNPICDLTEKVRKKIVKLLEKGIPWQYAAAEVMVPKTTVMKWKARGQELEEYAVKHDGFLPDHIRTHDKQCYLFYHECEMYQDRGSAKLINRVLKASQRVEFWGAAKWLLQVRDPEQFGSKAKTVVNVNPNNPPAEAVTIYMPDNGRDTLPKEDKKEGKGA